MPLLDVAFVIFSVRVTRMYFDRADVKLSRNSHGISLSSSLPPWSSSPPAAHRRPEPTSRSLPELSDQATPMKEEPKLLTETE